MSKPGKDANQYGIQSSWMSQLRCTHSTRAMPPNMRSPKSLVASCLDFGLMAEDFGDQGNLRQLLKSLSLALLLVKGFVVAWDSWISIHILLSWCLTLKEMEKATWCFLPGLWTSCICKLGESLCMAWSSSSNKKNNNESTNIHTCRDLCSLLYICVHGIRCKFQSVSPSLFLMSATLSSGLSSFRAPFANINKA